ncbi:Notchless protein [Ceratobasidium sp. AG-Ba]|nr:Notchless protein [Ceratobasidium sp. AG-Ba]
MIFIVFTMGKLFCGTTVFMIAVKRFAGMWAAPWAALAASEAVLVQLDARTLHSMPINSTSTSELCNTLYTMSGREYEKQKSGGKLERSVRWFKRSFRSVSPLPWTSDKAGQAPAHNPAASTTDPLAIGRGTGQDPTMNAGPMIFPGQSLHAHTPPGSSTSHSFLVPQQQEPSVDLATPGPDSAAPMSKGSYSGSSLKSKAHAALIASLAGLRKSAGGIPVLQSAINLLMECIENITESLRNHDDYEAIASDIAVTVAAFHRYASRLDSVQAKTTIGQLETLAQQISHKQKRTLARTYVECSNDIDDLAGCYRRVDVLFRQLQGVAIFSTWETTNQGLDIVKEEQTERLLQRLDHVKAARYNSKEASQVQRTACTPNTRKLVLQQLQDWAEAPDGVKLYWMNGMAGTGKTTIAYSLCSILEAAGQLAAGFFCSRSFRDCTSVHRIAPTIAYQLARLCPPYRNALCEALRKDPDIGDAEVKTQFEKLLDEPLRRIDRELPRRLLVVVIDALDELSQVSDAYMVLDSLIRLAGSIPVRFFVTCRPDTGLMAKIQSDRTRRLLLLELQSYAYISPGNLPAQELYHLHDIELSLVQADIQTYLEHKLKPAGITEEQVKRLAEQSGSLFIYASTAVQYVGLENQSLDHEERLRVVLGMNLVASTKSHKRLDDLYSMIVSTALENQEKEKWEMDAIRTVLYTIICAREPLTLTALAKLLALDAKKVERAIEPLRSVVRVDPSSGIVATLHASFPDYILSEPRSGRFWCNASQHTDVLARACFDKMNNLLRFNICSLESSFLLDEQVSDIAARMENAIPVDLYYACQYWIDHGRSGATSPETIELLDQFLKKRLLFWMEVMNLKNASHIAMRIMSDLCKWSKETPELSHCLALCQDGLRFATTVAGNAVRESTPHIYVSMLPLWDRNAPIWKIYAPLTRGLVKLGGPGVERRSSGALSTWKSHGDIVSMAVSPNGHVVATGLRNGTVCTWDAHSGRLLKGPMKGHTGGVYCVAFARYDSRIVIGSSDKTVRIWDLETSRAVGEPMAGHTDWVLSVCYSPDDRLIASGSDDGTIRIWDSQTREQKFGTLEAHEGSIYSVAFSPDGQRLVSGSGNGTIQVWDASTGRLALDPLTGHTGSVRSVAISPDGRCIVSGSEDKSISIWDALTGTVIGDPLQLHTNSVTSVSYSTDGRYILSGSRDRTVRVWDAHTRRTVAGPFSADTSFASPVFILDGNQIAFCSDEQTVCIWDVHAKHTASGIPETSSSAVWSIAFSPDSSRIVSGCGDGTMWIWDAQTGTRVAGPLTGHTEAVNSVTFSSCGSRIASSSYDNTVRIWDVHSGNAIREPYTGHGGGVNSVAFSPDGTRIASGSDDRTIHVWDVESRQLVAEPFHGHTERVWCVVFSPNGQHIASSSAEHTVRIWDAATRKTVAGPFQGGTLTLAYSPDGTRLASDYDDCTVVVRDARTGDVVAGPCKGHTYLVRSVAFSPDGRFVVSGSYDRSIRVWDAQTGEQVSCMSGAHTREIYSVAYSDDGHLVASCSPDGSIRVWDARMITSVTANESSWKAPDEDGWVVRQDGARLFWVPTDLRAGLKWPQNVAFMYPKGDWQLDFGDAYIGDEWAKCYVSDSL